MTVTFRDTVETHDIVRIESIVRATAVFSDAEQAVAVEMALDYLWRSTRSGYHFCFACRDNDVAGYSCFGQIPCTESSFDLYWIVVDPHYQNLGIGTSLLHHTESAARTMGARQTFIETSSHHTYTPTHRFYERNGYYCIAELPDFYAPGDNKKIFVKKVE
jgi:ribosomal protein S18 acetylase RimI-like enzyme